MNAQQFRIDVDELTDDDGNKSYRAIFMGHNPIGHGASPMEALINAAQQISPIYGGRVFLTPERLRELIDPLCKPVISDITPAADGTFYVSFARAISTADVTRLIEIGLEVANTITHARYHIIPTFKAAMQKEGDSNE